MKNRIPDAQIRTLILRAIGPHSCIHEAREHGVFVTPLRDRAIELAMPLGTCLAKLKIKRLADDTRVTLQDLEGSAFIGVIDGIDRYDPTRGVLVSTHVTAWINNRMRLEIERNHWRAIKPSKEMRRAYLGTRMNSDERREYEAEFCDFNHFVGDEGDALTMSMHGRVLTEHRQQDA